VKINKKKLEAFRKNHTREIFCTKEKTYDIIVALFLIDQDDRDPETVEVEALACECGFLSKQVKEEDGYLFFSCPNSTSNVVIDQGHVQKKLDIEKPLVLRELQKDFDRASAALYRLGYEPTGHPLKG
jgi:hypothetical protein